MERELPGDRDVVVDVVVVVFVVAVAVIVVVVVVAETICKVFADRCSSLFADRGARKDGASLCGC